MTEHAIILLNNKGLPLAKRLQKNLPEAIIWGLEGRVEGADRSFAETGEHIRAVFAGNATIIGIMATGILIRALAPALGNKRREPPVLALSDDGKVIIPLLGGLTGANERATEIGKILRVVPSITASGARHFGLQLEAPPEDLYLANPEAAKVVTSDILSGKSLHLIGQSTWLENSDLPFSTIETSDQEGAINHDDDIIIKVTPYKEAPPKHGLLYHPKTLLVELEEQGITAEDITRAIKAEGLARQALAALICPASGPVECAKQCANDLAVPLCLLDQYSELTIKQRRALTQPKKMNLIIQKNPQAIEFLGRKTGKLSVVGLGPGPAGWRTPEVTETLNAAEILVGYETYLNLLPKRLGQKRFASSNRVERERAREALDMAANGHHVAVVSSGDPGIFAMASAVIEVIDAESTRWQQIELEVLPGVSAMQAAAARIGAPLGHDFAVISLSDILKPFDVIKDRLKAAAQADMVIAIYNPASKTRREQIETVKALLLAEKTPETPVLLAKNVGRRGEEIITTLLSDLNTNDIDMRTLLIIGSSKTKAVAGPSGETLLYTPRTYR